MALYYTNHHLSKSPRYLYLMNFIHTLLHSGSGNNGNLENKIRTGVLFLQKEKGVAADNWHHIELESANQLKVRIDYQMQWMRGGSANSTGVELFADPLSIEVSGMHLEESDSVQIVLMNYQMTSEQTMDTGELHSMYNLSLMPQYDNDFNYRFAGRLSDGKLAYAIYHSDMNESPRLIIDQETLDGGRRFRQEIAVAINGHWLEDPHASSTISNRNFSFNMIY